MDAYKKGQISLFDYFNSLAANIQITQYIDDDFVIDYSEEVEEQIDINDRRSTDSLPEMENVSSLLAETSINMHDQQQLDTSEYLRELEEQGEADI